MIRRWRKAHARRLDDKAVMVTALLAHLGPLTHGGLWRYVRGSAVDLFQVLVRLEECGRIESEWVDRPHPRRHLYRIHDTRRMADGTYTNPGDEPGGTA